MTKKRHIDSDKRATARVMQLAASGQNGELDVTPNWLGHTRGSARLDKALIKGAAMKELLAIRKAITQHFDHLSIEHGLEIHKDGDVYRLVVPKS
ncbi:hypothetical protein B9Z36_09270 [Limnohabitans sp. Rim8]|jgi:hypothetical protein|uniref:hypothetical protein n=1 Tax=Limnohabitans sp. Rim8 TaxID=1100718 RepID=UPI000D399FB0|nr:hypothetical protein [Limnohabitans sp. Rim8]PUE57163.1 hypothetical protein B9Z36_09270 [Limnohabitans sp. Rim8]